MGVCPECKTEYREGEEVCPSCGYPLVENKTYDNHKDKNIKETTKKLKIISTVSCVISVIFFFLAFYVKNVYSNSTYNPSNAYVGGDAYNYIINGTYFAGYMVMAVGMLIVATIFFTTAIGIEVNKNGNN